MKIKLTDANDVVQIEKSDGTVINIGDYNDLTNKPTIPTIPTNVSDFTNDAGYLTQHQDISGKANSTDLATVATSGDYDDLTNKPTLFSGDYDDLTNKPTIPTVPGNESASSGGTTLSVVTTGEKYTWNNKANIWRGTLAEYDLILTPDDNTIYIIIPDVP